jgi:hypothetical protein
MQIFNPFLQENKPALKKIAPWLYVKATIGVINSQVIAGRLSVILNFHYESEFKNLFFPGEFKSL